VFWELSQELAALLGGLEELQEARRSSEKVGVFYFTAGHWERYGKLGESSQELGDAPGNG